MAKYPYIQLYTGDWMKDPRLSLCSPATRGIWIDLICAMHENNRSGEVSGTSEQLSRLCRCKEEDIVNAINELDTSKTADVIFCNSDVTVINRRMKREYIEREATRIRVGKHRNKNVTPNETEKKRSCNKNVTKHISLSSSLSVSKSDKKIDKNNYGEHVFLSAEEAEKLKAFFGERDFQKRIDAMNSYAKQIGTSKFKAKYRSHYDTMLNWYRMECERKGEEPRHIGDVEKKNNESIKSKNPYVCEKCGQGILNCECGESMKCPLCGKHIQECKCGGANES